MSACSKSHAVAFGVIFAAKKLNIYQKFTPIIVQRFCPLCYNQSVGNKFYKFDVVAWFALAVTFDGNTKY